MTEPTAAAPTGRQHRTAPTKAIIVRKLLLRPKGASLAEIIEATGWLPHSARAFMTGLRKKGHLLVRECRTNGETAWRIER
jgi:Protein of unknown function (DUF3489)